MKVARSVKDKTDVDLASGQRQQHSVHWDKRLSIFLLILKGYIKKCFFNFVFVLTRRWLEKVQISHLNYHLIVKVPPNY
jgi:hypothetical protein